MNLLVQNVQLMPESSVSLEEKIDSVNNEENFTSILIFSMRISNDCHLSLPVAIFDLTMASQLSTDRDHYV